MKWFICVRQHNGRERYTSYFNEVISILPNEWIEQRNWRARDLGDDSDYVITMAIPLPEVESKKDLYDDF